LSSEDAALAHGLSLMIVGMALRRVGRVETYCRNELLWMIDFVVDGVRVTIVVEILAMCCLVIYPR